MQTAGLSAPFFCPAAARPRSRDNISRYAPMLIAPFSISQIRRAGVQKKFILFGPQSPLEAGCKRTRIGSPLPVAGGPRFLGGVSD
jgi:hypothetical protein